MRGQRDPRLYDTPCEEWEKVGEGAGGGAARESRLPRDDERPADEYDQPWEWKKDHISRAFAGAGIPGTSRPPHSPTAPQPHSPSIPQPLWVLQGYSPIAPASFSPYGYHPMAPASLSTYRYHPTVPVSLSPYRYYPMAPASLNTYGCHPTAPASLSPSGYHPTAPSPHPSPPVGTTLGCWAPSVG